jgi:3-oxoacyl-[acyl-carrier protein] reductase
VHGPEGVLERAEDAVGALRASVVAHAQSGVGGLLETDVAAWDPSPGRQTPRRVPPLRGLRPLVESGPGEGRIVLKTSRAPLTGEIAYASKGAIEWLALSLAAELAPRGITVNVTDPGPTDTGRLDSSPVLRDRLLTERRLGRLERPEDSAALVAFRCSPAGGWINGQGHACDGGRRTLRTLRRGRESL